MKRSTMLLACSCAVILALAAGCTSTRTIYIPHGEPVRLRETIENVKIWAVDADGKPVAGKIDLPEGWYVLPHPAPAGKPTMPSR